MSLKKKSINPKKNTKFLWPSKDSVGFKTTAEEKPAGKGYFSQITTVMLLKYTVVLGLVFSFVFLVAFWAMVGTRKIHVLENFRDQELIATLKWLQERQLKPIVYEKLASEVDRHRIISQSPEPGMFVKEGRAVTLIVSVGTKLEMMSDFIGMEFGSVKKQIYNQLAGERRIPRVVKIERFSATYPEGMIIDQLPRPNERIDVEQDIVFFVSRGIVENVVRIQDLRMDSYRKVYNTLSSKGINVQANFLPTSDPDKLGLIFEQSVPPGTTVIQGSVIKLTVAVKSDALVESDGAGSVEKLRVLVMRVPFPATSLKEVAISTGTAADYKDEAYYCPCLGTSAIYKDRTALSNVLNEDNKEPPVAATVLRKIELVITDAVQKNYRVTYRSILAGRIASFPYRTIGAGSLSVYIDGEFYKNERFAEN